MKKSTVWTECNGWNAFFLFHRLTPILKVGFQFGTSRVPCGPCLHAGHRTVGGLGPFGWVPWPDVDGWLNIWCWHAADAERPGWIQFARMCLNMLIRVHFVLRSISWLSIIRVFTSICHMLFQHFQFFSYPSPTFIAFLFFILWNHDNHPRKSEEYKKKKEEAKKFLYAAVGKQVPDLEDAQLELEMVGGCWKVWGGVSQGAFCACKNWPWIRTGWCLSLLELPWLTGASCGSQLALTDRASEISWNFRIFVVKCSNARGLRVQAPEMLPGHKTPLEGRPPDILPRTNFQWPAFAIPAWRFHTSKPAFSQVSICVATVPLLVTSSARQHPTLWQGLKKRWPRHWCSRCGHEWTHLCQQYPECPRALGCSCHLLRNVMRDCQAMARMWYLV